MGATNKGCEFMMNALFDENIWVALYTVAPGEDGTGGTEVSAGGYARTAVTDTDWNEATDADPSVIDNSSVISFGPATANWGTVVAVGLTTASSGGDIRWVAALDTNRTVNDGDSFQFSANALNFTLD